MAYTDLQMMAFSRIAYMDLNSSFQAHRNESPVNLGSILSPSQKAELTSLGIPESEFSGWSLAAVHDTNADNGFYCCVIETSPGSATVAFRGSEGMESGLSNAVNDWALADLGLLNSTQTTQQAEIHRFYEQNQQLLQRYDHIATTGHSLGGNLAEYATVMSTEYGLDGRIDQCVSLDGPGFSNEFISRYRGQIDQVSGKMRHVRYSTVGRLLNDLPGVSYQTADVRNVPGKDKYNSFTRHDMAYINIDPKTGMAVPGKTDFVAGTFSMVSKVLDHCPPWISNPVKWFGQGAVTVVGLYNEGKKWLKNAWNKVFGKKEKGGSSGEHGSSGSFHGGGAGRSFGGNANVIKVSTEDMRACIQKYQTEKQRLMDALQVCNKASQTLARSWAGPSFLTMSIKLANTYKNLLQSMNKMDDAISELNKTIEIMERAENTVKSNAASLDLGDSPFL